MPRAGGRRPLRADLIEWDEVKPEGSMYLVCRHEGPGRDRSSDRRPSLRASGFHRPLEMSALLTSRVGRLLNSITLNGYTSDSPSGTPRDQPIDRQPVLLQMLQQVKKDQR